MGKAGDIRVTNKSASWTALSSSVPRVDPSLKRSELIHLPSGQRGLILDIVCNTLAY